MKGWKDDKTRTCREVMMKWSKHDKMKGWKDEKMNRLKDEKIKSWNY